MNILVINGSPKGKYSTTLQTVLYLQILFGKEHEFSFIDAGTDYRRYEQDFSECRA